MVWLNEVIKADLPSSATFGATLTVVVALSYTLAAVAPHIRSARHLHREWSETKSAVVDGMRKFTRLQESIELAKEALSRLDDVTPENVVQKMRTARAAMARAIEDLDLSLLAFETMHHKFEQLKKHHGKQLVKLVPQFAEASKQLSDLTENVKAFREVAENFQEARALEQFDDAIELAVEATTNYVMGQSLALALEERENEPSSVEDALAPLKKIHDYARKHGVKLSA